ncbi:hypothetical protein NCCP691_05180 [Noviherbaspirillum aridicola]|uniref:Uncharacterized protein n=2 Tax=Noviherbaspirillum aridicola TaxID=2849687 RepID=A0ABQ4Q060_9BURK|nr:hypothetical protein NCCP691_05180 [Noviherbaspirillum aridicola]
MANTLSTRTIAEHLSTLARLLEAEAARADALGLQSVRDLAREAREVRALCDLLWEADSDLPVVRRDDARGKVVPIGAAAS